MSAEAPDKTGVVKRLSGVAPEDVQWLWPGRLPLGKVAILDGDPGLGKTTLALDLAARLTTGRALPDGWPCAAGGVVILSAEDGLADTIRPRLEAAGADCTRVLALEAIDQLIDQRIEQRPLALPTDLDVLEQTIVEAEARLVIIDPIMAYLDGAVNANRDQDVRRALAPLAALAGRTGACVLCIRHLNKMPGANALYRGGGSIGIIGAARAGLLVAPDPADETRRVLAVTKNNLAAPAPALLYRLEAVGNGSVARIAWEGTSGHTAATLLAQPGNGEERHELTDAESFLLDALRDGPRLARDVLTDGRQAGIGERTLKRAKASLRVDSRKQGQGGWTWELPSKGAKDAKGAKGAGDRPLGTLPANGHGCLCCTLPVAPGSSLCAHCLAAGRRPEEAFA